MGYPGSGGPWEWRTLGVANPGSDEPWEWRTLGVVNPGSGEPWEWCILGVANPPRLKVLFCLLRLLLKEYLNIYLSTLIPQLTNAANTADLYQVVGGQKPVRGRRPLWRPEVFRRAKPYRRRTLRLAYSFSRQALAKPCRR